LSKLNQSQPTQPSEFLSAYNEFKQMNPDASESNIQTEFAEVWSIFQNNKRQEVAQFSVDRFLQDVYSNSYQTTPTRKYKKSDIKKFLQNPSQYEAALREVGSHLYYSVQEYKNLIHYFSKMLTFDSVLVPDTVDPTIYNNQKKILASFYDNLQFLQDYNLKYKLGLVTDVIVKEDLWFGYERSDGAGNYLWQRLPSNYCKMAGMDLFETYVYTFDFSYFDNKNVSLENYDSEFAEKYQKYRSNQVNRWQKLDGAKAICFKFDESVVFGLPSFSGMFEELFKLEEVKDLQETSNKVDNYKLLVQRIPMETGKDVKAGNFLISETDAAKFHGGLRKNIPDGIGATTTPMEISAISLKSQNSGEEDLVAKETRNLFATAGVSQLVFSSKDGGSIGLSMSVKNDSTIMFSLLRQYETWCRKRFKLKNGASNKYRWKLNFLNITQYNKDEEFKKLIQSAQGGYSKLFVSASLGLTQSDHLGLTELEDTILNITEKMKPLVSSHTQNGEGGKPPIDEGNLSENGAKQRDNSSNLNRSK